MDYEYEKLINTYCKDINDLAKTLDYEMSTTVKTAIVVARLKNHDYDLYYTYEILIEAIIETYFEQHESRCGIL